MFVEFFVRRPIFSAVCSVLIVLAGLISIPGLPVAQYPEIAPPQVTVTSNYIGANARNHKQRRIKPLDGLLAWRQAL